MEPAADTRNDRAPGSPLSCRGVVVSPGHKTWDIEGSLARHPVPGRSGRQELMSAVWTTITL
jgi:hypothetical protein